MHCMGGNITAKMFCSMKQKVVFLLSAGLIIATIGFIIYVTFPIIMDKEIKKRLVIKEGTQAYEYWKNIPVPIYIKFYFFNVTNPEGVYNLEKPILEELGPYTFREEREKVNITWNENGTVSYRQIKRWYFQPDKTHGSLDDMITTLNVPMVSAGAKALAMNEDLIYYGIEVMFNQLKCPWLVNRTVDQFLFKGYDDDLIKMAQPFVNIPYDKFGWFYKRNNTDDGEFVVHTGEEDITTVDEILTWNNRESVTSYSPPCNMINGTAGDGWSPDLSKRSKPTLFVPDICRSLSFTYLEDVKVNSIPTYRYWADNTELDNGKINPDNKCFCSDDICLPAGGVNVSTCKFDAPAVISYPHFLFADPIYREGVDGMQPNPEEHRMYLDLIPQMGIPLGVAARMQINVVFEKVKQIKQFSNITKRIYFPMIWFSETAEVGDDIINQIKLPLVTLPLVVTIISFVLVAIGSVLVLTAFVLAMLYAMGKISDKENAVRDITGKGDNIEKPKIQRGPEYAAVSSGASKD